MTLEELKRRAEEGLREFCSTGRSWSSANMQPVFGLLARRETPTDVDTLLDIAKSEHSLVTQTPASDAVSRPVIDRLARIVETTLTEHLAEFWDKTLRAEVREREEASAVH